MTQLGFFVDVSKCSGCKTCAVACKDAHNLPVGMNFRKVHEYAGGNWKQAADGSWAQDVLLRQLRLQPLFGPGLRQGLPDKGTSQTR